MARRASGLVLALLTIACASGPRPVFIPPANAPLLHMGVNLGPERMTPDYLQPLSALGTPLVLRVSVHSQAEARDVLASVVPYSTLSVLVLIEQPDLALVTAVLPPLLKAWPGRLYGVELVNEPELQGLSAKTWGVFVNAAYRQLTDAGFQGVILSGGLYTIDQDTAQYMRDAMLPTGICHAWHYYGDWTDTVLATAQQFGCWTLTETGAPSRNATEDAGQLAYLSQGKAMAQRGGATDFLIYQLVSGPSASNLDNFGLLRFAGSAKPAYSLLAN